MSKALPLQKGKKSSASAVSLASGRVRKLTKPGASRYDDSPAWSPVGDKIAFTRRVRGQPPVIYTVTLDGRARRITKGGVAVVVTVRSLACVHQG